MRRVMSLPFLPGEHIPAVLNHMEEKTSDEQVKSVMLYVRSTWINGYWSTEDWSVFRRNIRTNNDLEGYHNRLNKQGKSHMPLYELIGLLHTESAFVSITARLVSEKKMNKRYSPKYAKLQEKINQEWEKYEAKSNNVKNALSLLKAISTMHGPILD